MSKGVSWMVAMLISTVSTGALAQEAPVQTADVPGKGQAAPVDALEAPRGGLQDIVVTATRREERLQDIPVTVTAITGEALQSADVTSVRNLTQVVPAFNGGRNFGVFLPVIRGVGSSGISVGDESNVATYIDGIYQADPWSTYVELVEVDRVEVLRGPQGTVFGRNATGGLINVITPDPSFHTSGRVSARYGRLRNDASDYDLRAYVTTGLTDTLAADLATVYRKTDSYIEDLVRGGHVGGQEIFDIRSKMLFQPSDTAEFVLTGEYFEQNSSVNSPQPLNGNTAGRNFPGVIMPDEPWEVSLDEPSVLDVTRYNLALQTQFEFESFNLETSTGWMHTDAAQSTDSDASNIPLGIFRALEPGISVETISQEVRLLSAGNNRLNWILGAYAFKLEGEGNFSLFSPGAAGLVSNRFDPEVETTSLAGFAEGTYELVDALFLTLGARYTWEERKFRQVVNGADLFGKTDTSFEKLTYRAALRYNFREDANVYFSYGTGFKSGVYNMIGVSPNATDPETIDAWELGLKADPLYWLRANLSVYYYDYQDLQVQARDANGPGYVLQNAANAEIYGGELELTAAVSDDLNLRTAAAYTHGKYESFPAAQVFVPLPTGGNLVTTADVSGNQLIRAPEWTFNAGFNWGHDLASGRIGAAGNVFHSTKVYHDFANNFAQPAYTLISGEVSWTTQDEKWRVSLWSTNLTNAKVFQQIRPGALSADVIYEMPRRIGIGAEVRF